MACYHPWQRDRKDGFRQTLPCGQCIGCRLERSRQWAVRIMHEASSHALNCVVTLTYDEAHLPVDGSLEKRAFPLFMRRLRKTGVKARYFHCGEYGEERSRPHYHGCLFGHDFLDKFEVEPSKSGATQWQSLELERSWSSGRATIGTLNFESAAYVARYVTKKVTGRAAEGAYSRVDDATGEVFQIEPEFATMSRRPGIGARWFQQFGDEVFPADEVICRGHPARPPRYYENQLDSRDLALLRFNRGLEGRNFQEGSQARLHVREVCTKARCSLTPRRNV